MEGEEHGLYGADQHSGVEPVMNTSHLVGFEDLPVAMGEVDLSSKGGKVVLLRDGVEPAKILTLVRLDSEPIGVVLLDGTRGLDLDAHSSDIDNALSAKIEAARAAHHRSTNSAEGNPPMVTIAIATRDRTESLRACLESMLALDYPSYEIVVVDNGPSTEATAEMIATEFGSKVRYFREQRAGPAIARNRGLAVANGAIIAFTDDDVIADRHWLTAIVEGFTMSPDVRCVTGLIMPAELETRTQLMLEQHGSFDKGVQPRLFGNRRERPAPALFPFAAGQFGSGANMAFDTATLRRLGGFDPALGPGTPALGGEDLAVFFQIIVAGHEVAYQPGALVWHRHKRDKAAIERQIYGYGVGLTAFMASVLSRSPRVIGLFLRRLPAGLVYAFSPSSDFNEGRYDGWRPEFTRLEIRGLLSGPGAYVLSRWRRWRERSGA